MKKIKNISKIKKIFFSTLSALLAVSVLLTALPNFPMSADGLTPTKADNTTQTGFKDVIEFQQAKWKEISNAVFGDTLDDYKTPPSLYDIKNNGKAVVQDGNTYFNWKPNAEIGNNIPAWDGGKVITTVTEKVVTYEADSYTKGGDGQLKEAPAVPVTYKKYDVSNASELRYAYVQAYENRTIQNTMINIKSDIDLNGSKYIWEPFVFSGMGKWLYLEGNGHTIYNMKCYNCKIGENNYGNGGFLGNFDKNSGSAKLIVKNLNFSNCMSLSKGNLATAIAVGCIRCQAYFENVNVLDSFVFSNRENTGTLVGRTDSSNGNVFLRNCSSQRCYVYGSDHTGGLTGCQHNTGGNYGVKYNTAFPKSPETWMNMSFGWNYPEMVENCYSVDCTLFSVGNFGDSGGLLSCGGKLICRNSFTNNVVYGRTKTGAFFGRIVTPESGKNGLYDDNGDKTVEAYFENCYASGSIEGRERIGGFVGFVDGNNAQNYGVPVFKNCYTTAMVGMDYAGSILGGFVGHDNSGSGQSKAAIKLPDGTTTKDKTGGVYINCYVGGEVGNILTEDSVTPQSVPGKSGGYISLGGFSGLNGYIYTSAGGDSAEFTSTSPDSESYGNGTFVNCYYDMQTTAMRERACGLPNQFIKCVTDFEDYNGDGNITEEEYLSKYACQIPGVTGVYTQHSDKKNIKGLADNVDMGDDAWKNGTKDDMYPTLKVFDDVETIKDNFGIAHYGTDATDEEKELIDSKLQEKQDLVYKYSRASVSTVLLSHWDNTMNMNTGTLGSENDWQAGLALNKFEKVPYTEIDESRRWKLDNDGYCWEKTYKNLAADDYEFKVQQGTSWAYNFGLDSFNSQKNCVLHVPQDCDAKIKFDYLPKVTESGVNTNFKIWAEYYNKDGTFIDYEILGENKNSSAQDTWTAIGSFSGWSFDKKYDLHYVDGGTYVGYFDFEPTKDENGNYVKDANGNYVPATYEFKIARDHDWAESYGKSSTSDSEVGNMSFTITKPCKVKIEFDKNSGVTKLSVEPPYTDDSLTNVNTEEKITYKGYSLIGSKTVTCHEWFDGNQSLVDGGMTTNDDGKTYTKIFNVHRYNGDDTTTDNFNKTFGYKVIKNGLDTGIRQYYTLETTDTAITDITLTFTYDTTTGKTTISSSNEKVEVKSPAKEPDSYSVLGTTNLTGYDWGKENNELVDSEFTKMTPNTQNVDIWTKTFTNVPAGTHAFKVVANGDWNYGIDYGSSSGNNYKFTTTEDANITISFNQDTKEITVSSDPEGAIFVDSYVVCGNENLTKENKNTASDINKMTYNKETGLYEKEYELTSDQNKNYSFKIVRYSQNNDNDYNAFTVYSGITDDTETYKLKITYNSTTKTTDYHLYDKSNNLVDEYIKAPAVDFYCVAGDQDLTGYVWLDATTQTDAVNKGRMTRDENGIWKVTLNNVAVESAVKSMSFKVVANGEWSSGIDYGQPNGDNYIIMLASDTEKSCNVTITFDENTHKIEVSTTPNCLTSIDESTFDWYVCGTYLLVSDDAYKAPATIYDTVRDITADFSFTEAPYVSWAKDEEKNTESGFFDNVGGDTDNKVKLNYNVEGKNINGTFDEYVITLDTTTVTDGDTTYTKYSCTNFMPGKQWLTVNTTQPSTDISTQSDDEDDVTGKRSLRLIPTAYLEAGNDATVRVLQADSDIKKDNVQNIVTYSENSIDGITFTGLTDNDKDVVFDRYNFALTAAYAITDRTGLGCYGNYYNQNIQTYDENKIRKNEIDTKKANTYFMMTSAFTKSAAYRDTDIEEGKTTNLVIDELTDMSLIGSSYNDDENYAKKIVKIYKVEDVKDENGNVTGTTEKKIFVDSSNTSTEEYKNYLKWTGQQAFDSDDIGTYNVTYFWSLSDGRYLKDTKTVYIKPSTAEIEKTVDKTYIEKNNTVADKDLTYTLTYTNKCVGDYTILDVLPFKDDVRYIDYKGNTTHSEMTGDTTSFTLKSVSVTGTFTPETDATQTDVVYINSYYSQDTTTVQGYIKNDDGTASNISASKVDVNDGNWTQYTATSGDINNLTALAFTGSQTAPGTSVITIKYTITVNDPAFKDYYVNDAYYYIKDTLSGKENKINGFGEAVYTSVVGRCLSGNVWYDLNLDGIFDDSNEPRIEGVTVNLMKKQTDGTYTSVASQVTDDKGSYKFDDIYPASNKASDDYNEDDYRVEFSAVADNGGKREVTIKYSTLDSTKEDETVDFDSLLLSRRHNQYQGEKRNVAQVSDSTATTNKTYFINEILPNAEDIIANNNQQRYKGGSIERGYFLKENQNLALRPTIPDESCSLTVKKIDSETGDVLSGVGFSLEYQTNNEDEYKTMYVEKQETTDSGKTVVSYQFVEQTISTDGDITYQYYEQASNKDKTPNSANVTTADKILTGSDGLIKFTGLPSDASYKLTEVSTLKGYNMLLSGIEFTLPYYLGGATTSEDGYVQATGELDAAKGYYKDITYTITNSKIPNMPLTGNNSDYGFAPLVFSALLLTAAFIIIAVRYTKKLRNTDANK